MWIVGGALLLLLLAYIFYLWQLFQLRSLLRFFTEMLSAFMAFGNGIKGIFRGDDDDDADKDKDDSA